MRFRSVAIPLACASLVLGGVSEAVASVGASTVQPCAQPNGRVSAMVISAGTLYIGGTFTQVADRAGSSQPRAGLAAVDVATCELTAWTAAADNEVSALVVAGKTVYVGGSFTHLGGQSRAGLAALDAATGVVQPFAPVVNKPVRTLTVSDTMLYAGGEFTSVGGASRMRLAAFSLAAGTLDTTWRPKANAKVRALATDGLRVYVGGSFTKLNGDSVYPYLGAVDPSSGVTDPGFVPQATFPILDLAADTRGVYAGGAGHGGHLVVWNLDGSLQRAVYQTDGDVQAVAVDGDSVYGGGHFTNYCVGNTGSGAPFVCTTNLERRKLLEVSLASGEVTPWAPALDSPFGVLAATIDPSTHDLWVGGDFTHVSGDPVRHLARFPSL